MILVEVAWWVVAVATFGVGDAVTTVAGTRRAGLVERSPVVRRVAGQQPSIPALVGLKLVAFAIAIGTSYWLPAGPSRLLLPVGLAVVGTAVTAFNTWAIVVHGNSSGRPSRQESIPAADATREPNGPLPDPRDDGPLRDCGDDERLHEPTEDDPTR